MMTKLRQWLLSPVLIIVGTMMLAACSDTKDVSPPEQPSVPQGIPDESRTLVGVMKAASYIPDEFMKHLGSPYLAAYSETVPLALGIQLNAIANSLANIKLNAHLPRLDSLFAAEVGTESDGTRRWHFETYTFTYQSITASGEDITLSGRVTFPNNAVDAIGHEVATLSLHSHQDLGFSDCSPSDNLMFMPMRAMYNSAVIEPDFQSFGINRTKVLDGSASPKILARQLGDCVIAALELMQQHGVTLAPDGHTTNWGSSKNVSVPLAFARYYETVAPQWFRDAIRLGSTFVGEGNIDMGQVMPYYFQSPELYPLALSFMCYLVGLTPSQRGGYELDDIFSPSIITATRHIDDQDYTLLDAISLGFTKALNNDPLFPDITSLDQLLAPDLLTADGGFDVSAPKAQAFLRGLSEESGVYGWEPTLPIYIAHCPYDVITPYSYSWDYYLQLSHQETNPAVHWLDIPYQDSLLEETLQDGLATLHSLVSFFMHVYMSCVEEPADMAKMYK